MSKNVSKSMQRTTKVKPEKSQGCVQMQTRKKNFQDTIFSILNFSKAILISVNEFVSLFSSILYIFQRYVVHRPTVIVMKVNLIVVGFH